MHQYVTFIGGFPIRFYGIFFSLGIIFGCIMAYYFLKKDGRGWHECMFDLGLTIAFVGIIGGRLIFACIAGYIFLKKRHIPVLQFADIIAPAIIFGQAIGRIANFMNGDAFGHPTGADFGILYPSTTLAYHTYGAQPLWPAEVWECQGDLIILGLLLWYSCFKHARGTTFCLYIMLYSLLRFFLENFRGDYGTLALGLKSAQLTALAGFVGAAVVFVYFSIKYRKDRVDSSVK